MFSFPSRVAHNSTPTWCLKLFSFRIPAQLVALQISFLSSSVTPYSVTLFLCCLGTSALVILTPQSASQIRIHPFTHRRLGPPHTSLLGERTAQTQWRGHVRSHLGFSIFLRKCWLSHSCPQLRVPFNGGLKLVFSDRNMSPLVPILEPGGLVLTTKIISSAGKPGSGVVVGSWGKRGFVTVPATHSGVL